MNKENSNLKLCQQGYVYVILDNHGRVKIGKSLNPQRRIQGIASSSGITIEDAYITSALFGYSEFEAHLHDVFSEYRQIGEWFNCKFGNVITYIESSDMSEFIKEKYSDFTGINTLIKYMDNNFKTTKIERENGLIDPLVDVIEYMVGISNKPVNDIKYYASPESRVRIQKAVTKQLDIVDKLDYLANKCKALEKLNDCYSEQLYLDSELYSRLKDTSEIDELGKEYHDMRMDLNRQSLEALQEIMKPYVSGISEVIA